MFKKLKASLVKRGTHLREDGIIGFVTTSATPNSRMNAFQAACQLHRHRNDSVIANDTPLILEHYEMLSNWNQRLGNPVVIDGNFNALSRVDWCRIQLTLLRRELELGTLPCLPEQCEAAGLRTNDVVRWRTPLNLTASILYLVAAVGFTAVSATVYALTSEASVLAIVGLDVVGVILASRACLEKLSTRYSFATKPIMGVGRLSATWDDVFECKSFYDVYLIKALYEYCLRTADGNGQMNLPRHDLLALSPSDAYQFLRYFIVIPPLDRQHKEKVSGARVRALLHHLNVLPPASTPPQNQGSATRSDAVKVAQSELAQKEPA